MREIQLRDAKANLSAVVDEAVDGKPAIITRHGKKQAVVLSYEEWRRLSQVPSFGRLLMAADACGTRRVDGCAIRLLVLVRRDDCGG
jgi:antitoxin Phd